MEENNWSLYDIHKNNDDKHLVLTAPTKEELVEAFAILIAKIPKYRGAEIEWQPGLFNPDSGVGYIIR